MKNPLPLFYLVLLLAKGEARSGLRDQEGTDALEDREKEEEKENDTETSKRK